MTRRLVLVLAALAHSALAQEKLKVLTTTTDLQSIAAEIGRDQVIVESLARGTQDPHFVEAKPSFMTKASRSDLLISIGLGLEIGWLPNIVRGARNPSINFGEPGNLVVNNEIETIEKPTTAVSRADGDVHPEGNPHVTLDPHRAIQVAKIIANRLGQLRPGQKDEFNKSALAFENRMKEKTDQWKTRIERSGVKKIVTYHKTLSYFLNRFGIENSGILEPKPGIPPTSGHMIEIIKKIQNEKIPLILVENFFDPSPLKKIAASVPGIRSAVVPVSVNGEPGIHSLDDLFEKLVLSIEGAK